MDAYLDGGGNFFLSSQDYLYEFGLTPFGQNYLHIASFSSDVGDADFDRRCTGQNCGEWIGTIYTELSVFSPTTRDIVNPDAQGQYPSMPLTMLTTWMWIRMAETSRPSSLGSWVAVYNSNADMA